MEIQPAIDAAGDPLPKGAIARLGSARWRHDGGVRALTYSPDGRLLAGSCAGKIIMWESATGKRIRQLPIASAGELSHRCLDFSPDGKVLAVAHRKFSGGFSEKFAGEVSFWDVATGQFVRSLKMAGPFSASSLRFSPDGKSLAVTDEYGLVVGDADTGKDRWHKRAENSLVFDFVFSPDGKILAVVIFKDKTDAQLWDAATGQLLRTLPCPINSHVSGIAFSQDGKSLATETTEGMFIWDVATGKEQTRLDTTKGTSCGFGFIPDGNTLVSAAFDTQVYVWDLQKKKIRGRLGRPLGNTGSRAVLAPDCKTLAVGTQYSQIHVWDLIKGKELFTDIAGHDSWVRCLAFSPDGSLLASGGDLRQLRLWNTNTWNLLRSLDTNAQTISFTPNGRQVAIVPFVPTNSPTGYTGISNKPIAIWDVDSGKELASFPDDQGKARWAAFAGTGSRLVSLNGNRLEVWDVAGMRRIAQFLVAVGGPLNGEGMWSIGSPVLTPDGRTVILPIEDEQGHGQPKTAFHAIELATGKVRFVLPQEISYVVAVSADGKTLASTGGRLWDLAEHKGIQELDTAFGQNVYVASALAFSPNGRLLATAPGFYQMRRDTKDAPRIQLWDVKTGKEVGSFPGDGGFFASLAFSPDGSLLLSGMCNGSILVWDIANIAGGLKAK